MNSETSQKINNALHSQFPVRSQLPWSKTRPGQRVITFSEEVLDMYAKDQFNADMFALIKSQCPGDVFLFDNAFTGDVVYPMPRFLSNGNADWTSFYGIILGSYAWGALPEGSVIPEIQALFTKAGDSVTCRLKEPE